MIERRTDQRINADLKVVLSTPGGFWSRSSMVARSVDVSTYGIGLALDNPIETSGPVSLKIYGPSLKEPVDADGTVVWQGKSARGPYRAGLQFTDVGWSRIKGLMNSLSK